MRIPPQLAGLRNINGYTATADADKTTFHREGVKFLRELAKEIGMPDGTYAIRSNKAGPAVSGEVTLHGETLYVQLYESCVGSGGVSILYRTCRGLKDYSGGTNNDARMDALFTDNDRKDRFIQRLKELGGFAN